MASPASPPSLPSGTYTVERTGTVLKMSYGMFNDIMRLIGNQQDVALLLLTDAGTRDLVIRRLFTDNKKAIDKFEELVESFDLDILPEEVDGILAWVADHATRFLLSTGKALQQVAQKYQTEEPKEDGNQFS